MIASQLALKINSNDQIPQLAPIKINFKVTRKMFYELVQMRKAVLLLGKNIQSMIHKQSKSFKILTLRVN